MKSQDTSVPPAGDSSGPPPSAVPSALPKFPRQTPAGYYGPKVYGPNGYAIAAFVAGLGGGVPLSVIFACVALSKIRDTGQSGRSFAIAGLVLSAIWLPLEILAFVHNNSGS